MEYIKMGKLDISLLRDEITPKINIDVFDEKYFETVIHFFPIDYVVSRIIIDKVKSKYNANK
jgi:hypothetical protein